MRRLFIIEKILIFLIAIKSSRLEKPYQVRVLGVLTDDLSLPYSYRVVVPALHLATEAVNKIYENIRIQIVFRNGSTDCSQSLSGVFAAEEYYLNNITAVFGPGCTMALDQVGRMASYWNLPIFTAGGFDIRFLNKNIYTTLSRMSFSMDRLSPLIIEIIKEFNWHHVAMIYNANSTLDLESSSSIIKAFQYSQQSKNNNTFVYPISFKPLHFDPIKPNDIKKKLIEASKNARGKCLITHFRDLINCFSIEFNIKMFFSCQ